jgi:dTDP-4-dehydrorhamnose reductase
MPLSTNDHFVVVGAKGMLGTAWCRLLQAKSISHDALDLPEIDIVKPESLARTISERTTHVINCAAFTDVDDSETQEEIAMALNAHGVGNLATRSKEINATLVHYSTDYVFDGSANTPYPVDGPIHPINAYGRTKAAGETQLEESGCKHLLIRTSWVYAPWAKNFVRTMVALAESKDELKVVNDQKGRPTSAEHLASTSLKLLERDAKGRFHVCDGGECTWFEFADAIMQERNTGCVAKPCTSAEFPRPATRPTYGVLDLSKTEALLGPMPSWQHNLQLVLSRL